MMKNNFFTKIINETLTISFGSNKVLMIENKPTDLEYEFSQNIRNLLRKNLISIVQEEDIKLYLNWQEVITIWWSFFLLNCQLIFHLTYNTIVDMINLFNFNLSKYNIYLKFPILYPCWDKKYLVPSDTAILHIGKAPKDFLHRFYKVRKTIMIREICDDNLQNMSSIFQHNFNLDYICMGFMCWIGISKNKKFRIYSINGCSDIYDWNEMSNVELDILCKFFLKPDVPRHNDFNTVIKENMSINISKNNIEYFSNISDILTKQNLLPIKREMSYMGCNIKSYFIQKFLCNRNGMSYGFMAYQTLPKLGKITIIDSFDFEKYKFKKYGFNSSLFYFTHDDKYYSLEIPSIKIICTRSGCDKSNINPVTDLLLYKIKNFEVEQIVSTNKIKFQPSFDIWIILTQALCNAIICSILYHFNPNNNYVRRAIEQGVMVVHIHAFPDKNRLPAGHLIFGDKNPSISCGCIESSYYCLYDQLNKFFNNLNFYAVNYSGSLFLEKDHGIVLATNYYSDEEKLKNIFKNYVYGEQNFKTFT